MSLRERLTKLEREAAPPGSCAVYELSDADLARIAGSELDRLLALLPADLPRGPEGIDVILADPEAAPLANDLARKTCILKGAGIGAGEMTMTGFTTGQRPTTRGVTAEQATAAHRRERERRQAPLTREDIDRRLAELEERGELAARKPFASLNWHG